MADSIRYSIRTQTADSQVPIKWAFVPIDRMNARTII